jgi:peptidoglycan/LPS O-acetylase OafA/YrhL
VGRIPAIEAARGIAALMVVATHVQYFHRLDDASLPSWLGFMSNGGVGVNLFFVLSGLVLYLPYARGSGSTWPSTRPPACSGSCRRRGSLLLCRGSSSGFGRGRRCVRCCS